MVEYSEINLHRAVLAPKERIVQVTTSELMIALTSARIVGICFGLFSLVRASEVSPEFEKFLADRPRVAALIEKHSSLRTWLLGAFNGRGGQKKLLWNDESNSLSDHSLGQHSYEKGGIVVTVSKHPSPVDQLTIVIYECVNAQYEASYKALFDAAVSKKLKREEFVLEAMRIEHMAGLGARAVFLRYFRLSDEEAARTKFYRKIMHQPEDFEEFIRFYDQNRRKEFDARDYYRSVYDSLVSTGVMRLVEDGDE